MNKYKLSVLNGINRYKLMKVGCFYLVVTTLLIIGLADSVHAQQSVNGTVTDAETAETLPGVNILVKGTTTGASSDADGNFELTVENLQETLIVSFVGYQTREVPINGRTDIDIALQRKAIAGEELIVVGYGEQERSDVTGSVKQVSEERLDRASSINIAQAIQGSVSGVRMQTSSASAKPSEAILVRGRNSILADNSPLIIIDGIPGDIYDVHPNDVESIEVLKDASASAIYGSRGANGVILVSTKEGISDELRVSYNGAYSFDNYSSLPDFMNGEEFYNYKVERAPDEITPSEQQIYEEESSTDWTRLIIRQGNSQRHQLSFSQAFDNADYYLSLNYLDKNGIRVNDKYLRSGIRFNLNIQITDWLKFTTRTNFRYEDLSGASPGNIYGGDGTGSGSGAMNPLTHAYEEDGSLKIYPWPEDTYWDNPLETRLYDNDDRHYQPTTNNVIEIDFPFVTGLSYRLNTGYTKNWSDYSEYRGRDTQSGLENLGWAQTERAESEQVIIENILNYQREFGRHNLFATGLFSYEKNSSTGNYLTLSQFPNDFRSFYAADQAGSQTPGYTFNKNTLLSQMLRLNYGYDSRYLITITTRRDGYSAFGADTKWGIFPTVAVAWYLHNEDFFPSSDLISELKLRGSYGLNGNQAVSSYSSMARLRAENYHDGTGTRPGYYPSVLGNPSLGWESSNSLNFGIDFGLLNNRIAGDVNFYHTVTSDLLLARTISAVHGISSIVENIGETQNRGLELSVISHNTSTSQFMWTTEANVSWNQNKINSLYGVLDEEGNERDDVTNEWFIGQPIRVVYDYVYDGVWQSDEAEEAAEWGSEPGFAKLKDLNNDGSITAADDRKIIGRRDPNFLWGLSNTFRYRNFSLSTYIYGVHGAYEYNPLLNENGDGENRRNVIDKNFWTPDNPTNDWWANDTDASRFSGVNALDPRQIQNASFVRIKDISLSYSVSEFLNEKLGTNRLRVHVAVRNPITFTKWTGTDPEIVGQLGTPITRSFEGGLNFEF